MRHRRFRSRVGNGTLTALMAAAVLGGASVDSTLGWDEEGHAIVTRVALRGLPATMPEWVRSASVESRLVYLSAEPDRWRGQDNVHLNHITKPDHFMDRELLLPYGLDFASLPPLRREFTDALATQRALHPDKFGPYVRERDADYTRRVPGLLPYAIAEWQWKAASSWSTLRTYEKHRADVTDEMLRNARENVIFHMGILSHFVADGAQPLHTTVHYNGWSGPNPHGYTTSHKFHQYIDGGVLRHHGITRDSLLSRTRPATHVSTSDYWEDICRYLEQTHDQMEPLYALEKSGRLDKAEGKTFIENRLLTGGAMLAGIWASAYEGAVIDEFLEKRIASHPLRASRILQPKGR